MFFCLNVFYDDTVEDFDDDTNGSAVDALFVGVSSDGFSLYRKNNVLCGFFNHIS